MTILQSENFVNSSQSINSAESPILVSNKFITLQGEQIDFDEYKETRQKPLAPPDDVMIFGCKVACGSVWCSECYTRKGGSKRVATQLSSFDFRRTRQLVLTCDPKKFPDGPQAAFEYLRDKKAIPQFIHNLKRTSKVKVEKWLWVLEWHENGFPHWHLFVEVEQAGRAGMIGNEKILRHWKYGIIHESYIRNQKHWKQFTTYFGKAGYFDPKQGSGDRKKHQRELPEWAMEVTYRIRKMSSSIPKDASNPEDLIEEKPEPFEKLERNTKKKTYSEILKNCGESILCEVWYDHQYTFWKRLKIPYHEFIKIAGEYVQSMGYQVQMKFKEWMLFIMLFDTESEMVTAQSK